MSANKEIRSVRCEDLLAELVKSGQCVFFTLTTPDVVDYVEIRRRWRALRHDLCRSLKGVRYVMNYEIHPKGHGWHIHGVFDRFVPLREHLPLIHSFGFGRVDFRRVGTVGVANYLTKHCLKAYRGVKSAVAVDGGRLRLVNTSRGLPRLGDYIYRSDYLQRLRALVSPHVRAFQRSSFFKPFMFYSRLASEFGFGSFVDSRYILEAAFMGCSSRLINHARLWYNLFNSTGEFKMKKLFMLGAASALSLFVNASAGTLAGWSSHRLGETWKDVYKGVGGGRVNSRYNVVNRRLVSKKCVFTSADFYYSKDGGLLCKIDFLAPSDVGLDVVQEYIKNDLGIMIPSYDARRCLDKYDPLTGFTYRLYVEGIGKSRTVHFVVSM